MLYQHHAVRYVGARACVWVSHLSNFETADRFSRHLDGSIGGQPSPVFFFYFLGAFAKL